jgi:hypothetical protein
MAANDEPNFLISAGDGDAEDEDMNVECEECSNDEGCVQRAIAVAQDNVWSGLYDNGDNDNDVVEEDEGREHVGEEAEGEDPDHGWQMYTGWHDQENGLSALDMLGEDFERNFISNGEFIGLTYVPKLII